jgi:hypothetical protein
VGRKGQVAGPETDVHAGVQKKKRETMSDFGQTRLAARLSKYF